MRQGPDLVGHHSEAPSAFARASRLDRRIQGEQIRLLGNAANHIQHRADVTYLACQGLQGACGILDILSQRFDGTDCTADALLPLTRTLVCCLGNLRGPGGITRHVFDRTCHLCDRSGRMIEFSALALHTTGGVIGHCT
ncbi:hypothetical protein D3C81_945440 [compost metagenome]